MSLTNQQLTDLRALLEQYEAAAWSEGKNEARANDSPSIADTRQFNRKRREAKADRLQFEREIIKFVRGLVA